MTTTLLAVDDSKTMRRVLEITFAGEDYRTVLAASTDQARDLARAERPGVAVIDAGLPGGYDLCQEIKKTAPGTLVLMLSNKQQPFDKARGSSAGVDDAMDKPFDTQQLLDRVSAMIKRGPMVAATTLVAAQPSPVAASPYRAPAAAAATAPTPAAAPAGQVVQRQRSSTLSYGTGAAPAAVASPPAPQAAAPQVATAAPQRTTTFTGTPAVSATQAPAVVSRPPVPPVAIQHAPSPSPPAAAPAATAGSPAIGAAISSELAGKLGGIGLTPAQVEAVLALSRSVVEQVVWEVVPVLAETIIKEEIKRLTAE